MNCCLSFFLTIASNFFVLFKVHWCLPKMAYNSLIDACLWFIAFLILIPKPIPSIIIRTKYKFLIEQTKYIILNRYYTYISNRRNTHLFNIKYFLALFPFLIFTHYFIQWAFYFFSSAQSLIFPLTSFSSAQSLIFPLTSFHKTIQREN